MIFLKPILTACRCAGVLLFTLLTVSASALFADTIKVNTLTDLQKAINIARPGDEILLADGVYRTATDVSITCQGSKSQPITIAAEHAGKAEITGDYGFNISKPGAYVIVKGFKFANKASKNRIWIGTSFCRFTQNVFENTGDGEYLLVAGTDQEVDHNTFQNKSSMGRFIAIRGEGKQIAERLHIHNNYFHDFSSQGGKNGAEAFQFGLSGFSMSTSNSVVEYNLFERCEGENELISIKASGVTLRYNTIRNCPAQFTLRHGNKCQVYGNYFFNTPGLRIFGDDHLVYSNYFEGCAQGINIGNGDGEVADGALLTVHDRPDRVLIANNTLIDCKEAFVQQKREKGMGATKITIADNIVYGGGDAAAISGPLVDVKWQGNVVFNVKDKGAIPMEGTVVADPGLVKDASGVYHLKAINSAVKRTGKPNSDLKFDMDGQPRAENIAGADAPGNMKKAAFSLTRKDVAAGW